MAKPGIADEVAVLRFFEEGQIEKAEVLYRIVCEKMRERLRGEGNGNSSSRATSSGRKRQPAQRNADLIKEVPTPAA
jgi:hypothetical protein